LAERRQIVDQHWRPHRLAVESHVASAIERGQRVIHIASHSFTPQLHGEVRNADIGLLYDPSRPGEVTLARLWMKQLKLRSSALRVRLNYPYAGKGDGLTSTLRKAHGPGSYVGLESELNQIHVARGGAALRALRHDVVSALETALAEFAEVRGAGVQAAPGAEIRAVSREGDHGGPRTGLETGRRN
jgi:predicted N-formylglutamate amidohydrolase